MSMDEVTKSTELSSGGILHSLVQKWGHSVQTVSAIAVVIIAVMAIIIERNIADVRTETEKQIGDERQQRQAELERQEEQRTLGDSRSAAIDRSIALYNYFMGSENTKKLMTHHVEINRVHSHNKGNENLSANDARATFVGAVLSIISTKEEWEEVYRMLALTLNDVVPILRCGKLKLAYWENSQFPEKHEYRNKDGTDLPLCDRETFRTILLGPVSELFFSFRYFFYCENTLSAAYRVTIQELEVTIADYVYHDNSETRRIPEKYNFVFRTDRDKEIAIGNGSITRAEIGSHALPTIRLAAISPACKQFTSGLKSMNENRIEMN